MKARTAARVVVYALFLLGGFAANPVRSEGIPKFELTKLLNELNLPTPWHVDQVSYEKRGPHWQVDVYYTPRQIDPQICSFGVTTLVVRYQDQSYSVEDNPSSEKMVALEECGDVWRHGGNFGFLTANITDEELKRAVHKAFAVSGYTSGNRVEFESESLRPLLGHVRRDHLHWIEKQSDGDIAVSFFIRALAPDVLAIKLSDDDRESAYVYRENGPDITSIQKR